MGDLRAKDGFLNHRDGRVERARFYYGDGEDAPSNQARVDPEHHATWIEDDGTVGIRRGTAISVGASAAYSANYDSLEWGN